MKVLTPTFFPLPWTRSESTLEMHELSGAGGTKREDHPDNRLRIELPPELREIFFTDGDRALSFIEADSMTIKRKRVESAIKALLGLSILEEASKHIKAAGADINKQVRALVVMLIPGPTTTAEGQNASPRSKSPCHRVINFFMANIRGGSWHPASPVARPIFTQVLDAGPRKRGG